MPERIAHNAPFPKFTELKFGDRIFSVNQPGFPEGKLVRRMSFPDPEKFGEGEVFEPEARIKNVRQAMADLKTYGVEVLPADYVIGRDREKQAIYEVVDEIEGTFLDYGQKLPQEALSQLDSQLVGFLNYYQAFSKNPRRVIYDDYKARQLAYGHRKGSAEADRVILFDVGVENATDIEKRNFSGVRLEQYVGLQVAKIANSLDLLEGLFEPKGVLAKTREKLSQLAKAA